MGAHICEFTLRGLEDRKLTKITSKCFVVMSPTIGAVGASSIEFGIVIEANYRL